ncbi:carotenoid 1,2-hydratase [Grimontia sedimenti]|uniref:carotenoid 1,2-hydratase n=1 Tax=Grimontia sedimenti TaxID=2711294 RepID=UPI001F205654|nr:carotenoid 1,2-hydratase [Grimontia sedimenti]
MLTVIGWCFAVLLCLLALFGSVLLKDDPPDRTAVAALVAANADEFAKVVPGRDIQFPIDYGSHNDFRQEWWYVTGNLQDESGNQYGIQWTLFRSALSSEMGEGWENNQIFMAHAVLTSKEGVYSAERFSRGGIGQAGVADKPFNVWLDNWQWRGKGDKPFPAKLQAADKDFSFKLTMSQTLPEILQGDNGYSQKHAEKGVASYYFSVPAVAMQGVLELEGKSVKVSGKGWVDREWSTQALSEDQMGNALSCDVVTSIAVLRGEQPTEIIDVDNVALDEARRLSASIREALELPQWEVASRFHREAFLKNVLSVSSELAYVRREKRQQAFGNGFNEVTLSRDSDFPAEPQAAIVFDQFHLAGRGVKQTTSYATCMAPVPFGWLVDAGLGEESVSEFDDSEGVVVDVIERIYAGRVIGVYRKAAEGESLIRALATQIIHGELLDGTGARLTKEVKYWNLYQSLEDIANRPQVDVLSWLEQALKDLGVESVDDLELIDGNDFVFEGIPSWEFDDFAEKYPLELTLAELKLDVEYLKGKRTVVVHHVGGTRKDGPKRWELPSWSGWKVQYKKASRVIDVR